jgi:hypothetical protein
VTPNGKEKCTSTKREQLQFASILLFFVFSWQAFAGHDEAG